MSDSSSMPLTLESIYEQGKEEVLRDHAFRTVSFKRCWIVAERFPASAGF